MVWEEFLAKQSPALRQKIEETIGKKSEEVQRLFMQWQPDRFVHACGKTFRPIGWQVIAGSPYVVFTDLPFCECGYSGIVLALSSYAIPEEVAQRIVDENRYANRN